MSGPGGNLAGRSRWSVLSRPELARANTVLTRLDQLAIRQRQAIARLAADELTEIGADQIDLEDELRAILDACRDPAAASSDGAVATPAERAELASLVARVRRACQHNLALLAQARRCVSVLLGVDEDRAGYDRHARRLTIPAPARARTL